MREMAKGSGSIRKLRVCRMKEIDIQKMWM